MIKIPRCVDKQNLLSNSCFAKFTSVTARPWIPWIEVLNPPYLLLLLFLIYLQIWDFVYNICISIWLVLYFILYSRIIPLESTVRDVWMDITAHSGKPPTLGILVDHVDVKLLWGLQENVFQMTAWWVKER